MTPAQALARLLVEVTDAAIAGCNASNGATLPVDLRVIGHVITMSADVVRWVNHDAGDTLFRWDHATRAETSRPLAPWRARLVALLAEADPAPPLNRFRSVIPNAVPWRERRMVDAFACALARENATGEEAADVFAADNERLRSDLMRAVELNGSPIRIVIDAATVEAEPMPVSATCLPNCDHEGGAGCVYRPATDRARLTRG